MCGLDRAFNQAFQTSAMDEHMKKSLFKDKACEVEPHSKKMCAPPDPCMHEKMLGVSKRHKSARKQELKLPRKRE